MSNLNNLMRSFSKNKRPILTYVLISLPVLVVFVLTSISFYTNSISYDESYNLQVSENLTEIGTYSTNGSVFNGAPKLFDPYISTGPTLLVPIAGMFELFGIDVWQFRVVMNVIYLLFCILVVWFIVKATKDKRFTTTEKYLYGLFTLTLTLAFLGNSMMGKTNFFFAVAQGETLALCSTIATMVLMQHNKTRSAALLLGLAVLSKLIFALLVPFFLVSLFLKKKRKISDRIRETIYVAFIVLIPLILFELYKFAALGFKLSSYKANLKEFISFFLAGGGDPSAAITPLSMVKDRFLSIVSLDFSLFNITSLVILGSIVFTAYQLLKVIVKSVHITIDKKSFSHFNIPLLFIFGSAFLWLTWWFFVSSRPWTRYAIAPITMIIIACSAYIYLHANKSRRVLNYTLFALICALSGLILSTNPITNSLSTQRSEVNRVSEAYGEKDIYTFGWWQNPEVQFLAQRTSKPYDMNKNTPVTWVLTSKLHERLDSTGYKRDTTLCTETTAFDYYSICKIKK